MTGLGAQLREMIARTDTADLPEVIAALAGAHALALSRLLAPPTAQEPDRLVDAAAMADILNVPENWVRDAARAARIPFLKLGHYVRFSPPAVLTAVEKLPPSHNGGLCIPKKGTGNRGGRRQVSTECPTVVKGNGHGQG